MNIKWAKIDGFNDSYEISNTGLVRSIDRHDSLGRFKESKILKQKITRFGYNEVSLSFGKLKKSFKVHRLVAIAFLLNIENKKSVNHIDGIKTNNDLNNLEWVSAIENTKHAIDLGVINQVGEFNSCSKLTELLVKQIRDIYSKKQLSQRKLASEFNVSQRVIFNVVNFKSWKHV